MNDKFLSFLGLAKKSGNLVLGMDAVKEGIIKKNINLVLTASDVSDSSFEKINLFCEKNNFSRGRYRASCTDASKKC